jgi:toxin-antitoxin system PIN domain toxin
MRKVWLLDANLLIALTHAAHVHHAEAHAWFDAVPKRRWATCTLTQLAFVRLSCNPKVTESALTPPQVMQALEQLVGHPGHEYWDDAPAPVQTATLSHPAMVGHRQVTDAYLLALAAARSQCLATLDRGLVSFAAAADLDHCVELASATPMVQEPPARYRRGSR